MFTREFIVIPVAGLRGEVVAIPGIAHAQGEALERGALQHIVQLDILLAFSQVRAPQFGQFSSAPGRLARDATRH